MATTTTAVSAPGKVFLAGGYLVLDRAYTALVFGLSARISVVARPIETSVPGVQLQEIVVTSPQFLDSQWRYGYHLAEADGGIKVVQLQVYALTYIWAMLHASSDQKPAKTIDPSRLTVLADNDYYSQSHSQTANPTRFAKFPTTLKDAHKTGLGSSAALVTSLTASLLSHYLPSSVLDLDTAEGKRILHNLAQGAHCAAQGKIGSGFDVAAAVYGSCLYRRFSPGVLKVLPEPGAPGFAKALVDLVNSRDAWDYDISKEGVRLPDGVALRMCDVDCGTATVSMVKKVLAWRERKPEMAKRIWDELQGRNEELGRILASEDAARIRDAVAEIRKLIRAMGTESETPIEPESQTALLDALMEVEGVYNGVVPGAGGFDAVALLMRDDEATETRVREFAGQWSKERGGTVRLLDVKGEIEGVRREKLETYDGWLH